MATHRIALLKRPRGCLPSLCSRHTVFQERKPRIVISAGDSEPGRCPHGLIFGIYTSIYTQSYTRVPPRQGFRPILLTNTWKGGGRHAILVRCRARSSIQKNSEQQWLHDRWSVMEVLARACEEGNVDYVFVGSAAAQIQGVLPPVGEPQAVELNVQWDLTNRVGTVSPGIYSVHTCIFGDPLVAGKRAS